MFYSGLGQTSRLQCIFQGASDISSGHGCCQAPGDDVAGVIIQDRRQEVPAPGHMGPFFKNIAILGALIHLFFKGPGRYSLDKED